jgi:hypothetical protein
MVGVLTIVGRDYRYRRYGLDCICLNSHANAYANCALLSLTEEIQSGHLLMRSS